MKYCEVCKRVPKEPGQIDMKCANKTHRITGSGVLEVRRDNFYRCERFKENFRRFSKYADEQGFGK